MRKVHKALTIAGLDVSGEAGMNVDLRTFEELGVYGMSVLTTVVACDPDNNWRHDISPIPIELIEKQLRTVCKGVGVDALKTGMLGSAELVELVIETIKKYRLKNIVVDPVLVCKGIDEIMVPTAARVIKEKLLPLASIVTPNSFEAAYLADMARVETIEEIEEAARRIHELGARNVVIKSGTRSDSDEYLDVFFDGREFTHYSSKRLEGVFNFGAGCTFSAAIAASLANGFPMVLSVSRAKIFVTNALTGSFRLNNHIGAMRHWIRR